MKKLSAKVSRKILGGNTIAEEQSIDVAGFKCIWVYAPGWSNHGLNNIALPALTINGAQAMAMSMCNDDPHCCSVTCPGATYTGPNSI